MFGLFAAVTAILCKLKLFLGIKLVSGRYIVSIFANAAGKTDYNSMFSFFRHKRILTENF